MPPPHTTGSRSVEAHLADTVEAFSRRFGRRPAYAAAAPGRVNLIGGHTDYNNGFVLPLAIDRHTLVVADRARAGSSTFWAIDLGEVASADLTAPRDVPTAGFARYPLGIARIFSEHGLAVPNLDLAVSGTVPIGAGLASSAALLAALATLFEQVVATRVDPMEKARWCRDAEHWFAGTPCGIMDPLIAILARPGHALLIDCRGPSATAVPLPAQNRVTVVIADTHHRRALAESLYAERRRECGRAASELGVPSLREADPAQVAASALGDPLRRRARHVVEENQRVLLAAAALKTGDLALLGELMFLSHTSLRDDFEVSCPELDTLVETAAGLRGTGEVIGARMTGGGFGGCAVILCRPDAVEPVSRQLRSAYLAAHGRPPTFFTTPAAGSAKTLTV